MVPAIDDIKSKIDHLFSNTTVAQGQTRDALYDIRDHISMLLDTLEDQGEDECAD